METNLTNKITKKIKRIVFIAFIALILLGSSVAAYILISLGAVSSKTKDTVLFEVNEGDSAYTVISNLSKEGLIRNELMAKVYYKYASNVEFKAGKYNISKSNNVDTIFNTLSNASNAVVDSITVTFVEGKRITYFADKIHEYFGYDKDEVLKTMSDPNMVNHLIEKYWFITDDILNKDLYYPLEGYLFPDTYTFMKDASIEDIIDKLVSALGEKLAPYREDIEQSGKSIHSLLTMASMVELEAVTAEDRLMVAGVFYNRIRANMSMGSDVTTYYAVKKEMKDSLTMSDLNLCNEYNTRGTCAMFPVGPIANSSMSSIIAAIKPTESDYYFFVADKNNKVYFAKTVAEHERVIADLKYKKLWA